jgi:gamma-glutamylaminecyclotransferase
MKSLLFVYGTLKRGHQRSQMMKDQLYLGVAITKPKYNMFQMGSFPALVEAGHVKLEGHSLPIQAEGHPIHGEIYEVDDECLIHLDKVEGVREGLFERKYIELDRSNLLNLPTVQNVFDEYHQGRAVAYFYKRNIDGAPRNCGAFWALK